MSSTESEDRVEQSTVKVKNRPKHSIFALFSIWLSRQSLSRWFGLLFGNTRELELRLADKQQQIDWLQGELNKWQESFIAFQDSVLLSKGMKTTTPSTTPIATTRTITSNVPGENFQMEIDLERLKEKIIFHPEQAADVIGDLLATRKQRDRELAKRLVEWSDKIPDGNNGVVITT